MHKFICMQSIIGGVLNSFLFAHAKVSMLTHTYPHNLLLKIMWSDQVISSLHRVWSYMTQNVLTEKCHSTTLIGHFILRDSFSGTKLAAITIRLTSIKHNMDTHSHPRGTLK